VAESKLLYRRIANELADSIERSVFSPGDRLPSVRETGLRYNVSVPTVMQAYVDLEAQGLITSRPRSGFYVSRTRPEPLSARQHTTPRMGEPLSLQLSGMVRWFYDAARFEQNCPLGVSGASVELYPIAKFNRTLASICRTSGQITDRYGDVRGDGALRTEIARRALSYGCPLSPDDLIVTTGSSEALKLCLEATTAPGDIVAVESPTYVGILLALEVLHLRVVEIPSDPASGLNLDALRETARRQRIAALVVMPNFSNPTGSKMSDVAKRSLVELCAHESIPIIEDDAIGELSYGSVRPLPLKAFDKIGNVLLCGSLSKTLSPGLRLGWTVPGNYLDQVLDRKLCTTTWGVSFSEIAVAKFLRFGNFDRHLKRLRQAFRLQVEQMVDSISKHFPQSVTVHLPKGGFFIWIEMAEHIDAMELHMAAHHERVSIAPGPMFSASCGMRNYIRLNAGRVWTPEIEQGIKTLGRLIGTRN
jgi:DNA-binding transcriptional MocR family regulator